MSVLRPVDPSRRVLCTALTIALSSCSSTSVEHPASDREPVFCGTLVDAEGRALAHCRFHVNICDAHSTYGGATLETDGQGEFRIDSANLMFLWEPSDSLRILLLIGEHGDEAACDVSRAFPFGVHHLGQLVMAEACDPRPLTRLSDRELFATLEQAELRSERHVDACLRECARRGSPAAVEYLRGRIANGVQGIMTWRTALRRAQRQCDPITLTVPGSKAGIPVRTSVEQLPTVDLRFTNRGDESCTLDFLDDLAIDCVDARLVSSNLSLRPRELMRKLDLHTLEPGHSITLPVPLGRYLKVLAPGTYQIRFAWRDDAPHLVDETTTQLVSGLLYLYSEPFTLVVAAPEERVTI